MLRFVIIGLAMLFGAEIVAALVGVLVYDPEALSHGWLTVSQDTLALGWRHPFLPAALGLEVGFLVGATFGHLWLPQVLVVYR